MTSFIDKNKIISSSQFGFRHNHSTKHTIIHLTDLISNYLDNSHKVADIFLDISKALILWIMIYFYRNLMPMVFVVLYFHD